MSEGNETDCQCPQKQKDTELCVCIKSLSEVMSEKIEIPDYQRPYTWGKQQVEDLLNDVKEQFDKDNEKQYLLGTIIVYENEESNSSNIVFEIVDGQQRLVTLTLILLALSKTENCLKNCPKPQLFLLKSSFPHLDSKFNIKTNYNIITMWLDKIEGKEDDFCKYLLNKAYFVWLEAPTLDDAFTFFDSQNSRGKALERYDLLKAHHLVYLEETNAQCICIEWEKIAKDTEYIYTLMNTILTRTRHWIRGSYPLNFDAYKEFTKVLEVSSFSKSNYDKGILHDTAGGLDFFNYIFKYSDIYKKILTLKNTDFSLYKSLDEIDYTKYILNMYEAGLVLHYDSYKNNQLERFSDYLIKVLLSLRLDKASVIPTSPNAYVRDIFNIYRVIYNSNYIDTVFNDFENKIRGFSIDIAKKNDGIRERYYEKIGKPLLVKDKGIPLFSKEKYLDGAKINE